MWLPGMEDPLRRNGIPLQYSCMRNPIGRGASGWAVLGVAKSLIHLSNQRKTATYIHIEMPRDRQKDRETETDMGPDRIMIAYALGWSNWVFDLSFDISFYIKSYTFSLSWTELSTFCTSCVIFPVNFFWLKCLLKFNSLDARKRPVLTPDVNILKQVTWDLQFLDRSWISHSTLLFRNFWRSVLAVVLSRSSGKKARWWSSSEYWPWTHLSTCQVFSASLEPWALYPVSWQSICTFSVRFFFPLLQAV